MGLDARFSPASAPAKSSKGTRVFPGFGLVCQEEVRHRPDQRPIEAAKHEGAADLRITDRADPRKHGLWTLKLPGLGEFDFDPEFDLGQHGIEARIAGGGFQVGGGIAQPVHGGGVEIAREQPDLEVVEHVERAAATRHRALAPLDRILNALQRQQRIDAGGRLWRGGGSGIRG